MQKTAKPAIRFSKHSANPSSNNRLLREIGFELSGIYDIPTSLPGEEPETKVPFAQLVSEEACSFQFRTYCGSLTVFHTEYLTENNHRKLELLVIYHNAGKCEPARTLGKAKIAYSTAEAWLTNTLSRGFDLFDDDRDEDEIEKAWELFALEKIQKIGRIRSTQLMQSLMGKFHIAVGDASYTLTQLLFNQKARAEMDDEGHCWYTDGTMTKAEIAAHLSELSAKVGNFEMSEEYGQYAIDLEKGTET